MIPNKKSLFAAIEAEKGQQQFRAGIENFDTSKLKPTVTEEKNPLPTKEGWYFDRIVLETSKKDTSIRNRHELHEMR